MSDMKFKEGYFGRVLQTRKSVESFPDLFVEVVWMVIPYEMPHFLGHKVLYVYESPKTVISHAKKGVMT